MSRDWANLLLGYFVGQLTLIALFHFGKFMHMIGG